MAQYNYKAMDKNGKAKKGSIEAINLDKAKEKLKSEGLIVQDIKEQGAGKNYRKHRHMYRRVVHWRMHSN